MIATPLLDIEPEMGDQSQTPPALDIAERQLEQLPEGHTKELLQSTTQAWQEQIKPGLEKGVNWLVSKAEAWRNHQTARAALAIFQRGYERTGEKSYQLGSYTVR